jgi:hypothetical protein
MLSKTSCCCPVGFRVVDEGKKVEGKGGRKRTKGKIEF